MLLPTLQHIQYMKQHVDDSKVSSMIAAGVVCLTAAFIAVCLRFISRHIGRVKLKASDWLIVLALAIMTAYTVCFYMTIRYGMGRHVIMVTDPKSLMIFVVACECTYECGILAIKLSLLALYHQVFPLRWMRKLSITIALIIIAYTIAHTLSDIFQCIPIDALWDPNIKAKCIVFNDKIVAMGVISIITDVIVLVLPMPPVWGLKISANRKLQLSAMFSLGGLVCIISIVRLFYLKRIGSADATWDDVEGGELSLIECCMGIIAACLPACRPLVQRLYSRSTSARKRAPIPDSTHLRLGQAYQMSASSASLGISTTQESTVGSDEERLYGSSE